MSYRTSPGSPFGACFRPTAEEPRHGPPNLSTCLYQSDVGLFSLTWSRSLLGHALDLQLHDATCLSSLHLKIEPLLFWRRNGSRKLDHGSITVQVYWDLSRAKFGPGPEPESGFYVAAVVGGETKLLVGDSADRARAKTKAHHPSPSPSPSRPVLRREHVACGGACSTRARFGGKWRGISVNCGSGDEACLRVSVDGRKVVEVKRLRWKFRGNERVVVDGVAVHVSWDVYSWLFDGSHAVFMFRFEEAEDEVCVRSPACRFGMSGAEARKMRRRVQRPTSASAVSPVASASVMEWASAEEADRLTGFSLVVYAWRK